MSISKSERCPECENWKRRGDELCDQNSQLYIALNLNDEALSEMGDRIRNLHGEMLRLQGLLIKNNMDFQEG